MEITSIFQVLAICFTLLGWAVMLGLILWAMPRTREAMSIYKDRTMELRDGSRKAYSAAAEKTTGIIMWGEKVPVPFE